MSCNLLHFLCKNIVDPIYHSKVQSLSPWKLFFSACSCLPTRMPSVILRIPTVQLHYSTSWAQSSIYGISSQSSCNFEYHHGLTCKKIEGYIHENEWPKNIYYTLLHLCHLNNLCRQNTKFLPPHLPLPSKEIKKLIVCTSIYNLLTVSRGFNCSISTMSSALWTLPHLSGCRVLRK